MIRRHRQANVVVANTCRHHDVVPVESSVTGEVLAQLCTGCSGQLPPDFKPSRGPVSLFGGVTDYWTSTASALISAGYDPDQVLDALAEHT